MTVALYFDYLKAEISWNDKLEIISHGTKFNIAKVTILKCHFRYFYSGNGAKMQYFCY